MSIQTERDVDANLQIGPTTAGMVRIFVEAEGVEVPLDFDPDEAEEIAEEIARGGYGINLGEPASPSSSALNTTSLDRSTAD